MYGFSSAFLIGVREAEYVTGLAMNSERSTGME
jgi:hypothetical protein